jgi:hypothetical protein
VSKANGSNQEYRRTIGGDTFDLAKGRACESEVDDAANGLQRDKMLAKESGDDNLGMQLEQKKCGGSPRSWRCMFLPFFARRQIKPGESRGRQARSVSGSIRTPQGLATLPRTIFKKRSFCSTIDATGLSNDYNITLYC